VRKADYVYLDSTKTFNSAFYSVLVAKKVRYGLDSLQDGWELDGLQSSKGCDKQYKVQLIGNYW